MSNVVNAAVSRRFVFEDRADGAFSASRAAPRRQTWAYYSGASPPRGRLRIRGAVVVPFGPTDLQELPIHLVNLAPSGADSLLHEHTQRVVRVVAEGFSVLVAGRGVESECLGLVGPGFELE